MSCDVAALDPSRLRVTSSCTCLEGSVPSSWCWCGWSCWCAAGGAQRFPGPAGPPGVAGCRTCCSGGLALRGAASGSGAAASMKNLLVDLWEVLHRPGGLRSPGAPVREEGALLPKRMTLPQEPHAPLHDVRNCIRLRPMRAACPVACIYIKAYKRRPHPPSRATGRASSRRDGVRHHCACCYCTSHLPRPHRCITDTGYAFASTDRQPPLYTSPAQREFLRAPQAAAPKPAARPRRAPDTGLPGTTPQAPSGARRRSGQHPPPNRLRNAARSGPAKPEP